MRGTKDAFPVGEPVGELQTRSRKPLSGDLSKRSELLATGRPGRLIVETRAVLQKMGQEVALSCAPTAGRDQQLWSITPPSAVEFGDLANSIMDRLSGMSHLWLSLMSVTGV